MMKMTGKFPPASTTMRAVLSVGTLVIAFVVGFLAVPGTAGNGSFCVNHPNHHKCRTTSTTTTGPTTTVPTTTTTPTTTTIPVTSELPYDPASPWNTPIPSDAQTHPNNATFIQAIADNGLPLTSDPDQYTIPVYRFDETTPLVTVTGNGYFSTYDAGDNSRVGHGSPWSVSIPVPASAQPGFGSDGQIVLLDPVRGIEYGFWQFRWTATGASATNGYRYHTTTGYFGRFADGLAGRGAGTPYLAGLVRPWEIAQGHIDHALAFAYNDPAPTYVYPASKSDGGGVNGIDLPEGSRLQLNPALTDADFDRYGLSPAGKMMARALQTYGMYVIDHSGSSKVYVEYNATANWGTTITRSTLSGIPWSEFRVVQ